MLRKSIFLLLLPVILISCTRVMSPMSGTAPAPADVKFNLYQKASQDNAPLPATTVADHFFDDSKNRIFSGGDAPNFFVGKSRIEVENLSTTIDLAIKIEVSKTRNIAGDYDDVNRTNDYSTIFSTQRKIYSITKQSLSNINSAISFPNNRYLRITAYDKSATSTFPITAPLLQAVYLNRKKTEFFWEIRPKDLFFTPVLFRLSGNAGGFNLGSITPSLGMRLYKYNTNSVFIDNINLSGFISVTNYGDVAKTGGYQYSLAAGGFIDFSGVFQVGSGYSFKESQPYLVLGFSSALFSKIFGNN